MDQRFGARAKCASACERDGEADEHGRGPDEAVEDRDELRHRRHLHARGERGADGAADREHRQEHAVAGDAGPEHRRDDGDRHAGDAEQVAAARRLLRRQPAEAEDEEEPGDEIRDGDDGFGHRVSPIA